MTLNPSRRQNQYYCKGKQNTIYHDPPKPCIWPHSMQNPSLPNNRIWQLRLLTQHHQRNSRYREIAAQSKYYKYLTSVLSHSHAVEATPWKYRNTSTPPPHTIVYHSHVFTEIQEGTATSYIRLNRTKAVTSSAERTRVHSGIMADIGPFFGSIRIVRISPANHVTANFCVTSLIRLHTWRFGILKGAVSFHFKVPICDLWEKVKIDDIDYCRDYICGLKH
jgi:hypothetical protein